MLELMETRSVASEASQPPHVGKSSGPRRSWLLRCGNPPIVAKRRREQAVNVAVKRANAPEPTPPEL